MLIIFTHAQWNSSFGGGIQLPLALDFYSTNSSDEQARSTAIKLQSNILRTDYNFQLASEFRAQPPSAKSKTSAPAVAVIRTKLDWNAQQAALDKMFDNQLKDKYKKLPKIAMPNCLQNITLIDYQIQGIKWLVKRETDASPAPFYKKRKEKGQVMHLCEITQSSQPEPPKPIRGSLLCDEMGLGKSVQTIGECL